MPPATISARHSHRFLRRSRRRGFVFLVALALALAAFPLWVCAGTRRVVLTSATETPPDPARAQTVHFCAFDYQGEDPRLTLFVPPPLAADYGGLDSDEKRYAWIASRLREQPGIASQHDLGVLTLYGLGVDRDLPAARLLVEPGMEAGINGGARLWAMEMTRGPKQPENSREAVPVIFRLFKNGDVKAILPADWACLELAKSSTAVDVSLFEELITHSTTALVSGFSRSTLHDPLWESTQSQSSHWCRRLASWNSPKSLDALEQITRAWLDRDPQSVKGRLMLLGLHGARWDEAGILSVGFPLLEERSLDRESEVWAADVLASTVLQRPAERRLKRLQPLLARCHDLAPENSRIQWNLMLVLYSLQTDFEQQHHLASALEATEKWARDERRTLTYIRVTSALATGRASEVSREDYIRSIKFSWSQKGMRTISLALSALGIIILLITPWLTRRRRAQEPAWWLCVLWLGWGTAAACLPYLPPWAILTCGLILLALVAYGVTGPKNTGFFASPHSTASTPIRKWAGMAAACAAGVGFYVLLCLGYSWLHLRFTGRPVEPSHVSIILPCNTMTELLLALTVGSLLVPVFEEVVFRGFIFGWLKRKMPVIPAAGISATIFGLLHGLDHAIPVAVFGLLATWMQIRYRSLWPGMLLHALTNAFVFTSCYFDSHP